MNLYSSDFEHGSKKLRHKKWWQAQPVCCWVCFFCYFGYCLSIITGNETTSNIILRSMHAPQFFSSIMFSLVRHGTSRNIMLGQENCFFPCVRAFFTHLYDIRLQVLASIKLWLQNFAALIISKLGSHR